MVFFFTMNEHFKNIPKHLVFFFLFLQERRRQREHRLEDLHGAMYTWSQHLKNLIQLQIYEFNFQFVGSEFTAQGPRFEMILFACTWKNYFIVIPFKVDFVWLCTENCLYETLM